jgi:hypothetical protein
MKLRGRLQRLERSAALDGGCRACRPRRGLTVTVFSAQREDGTIPEPQGMPVPCQRCGEIPEQITHIVEVVVASPAADDRVRGLRAGESSEETIGSDEGGR